MMDLSHMRYPTCPHCHGEVYEWDGLLDPSVGNGDQVEFECEGCGGTVTVKVHIEHTFTTLV